MTNKEVINFLNQVRKILLDDKSWLESTIQPINEAFDMAINALTAQPKRTETHACDCVSRKAAIDAMTNTLWHYPNECYRNLNEYEFAKGLAELGLKSVPSAHPAEAIPVAFLEEQAKWFESMDNVFAKIEANNIRVMIKKYRSEKNERSD